MTEPQDFLNYLVNSGSANVGDILTKDTDGNVKLMPPPSGSVSDPIILHSGLKIDGTYLGLSGTQYGETKARRETWVNYSVDPNAVLYDRFMLAGFDNLMPIQDLPQSVGGIQVNSSTDGGYRVYGIANNGTTIRLIGIAGSPSTSNSLSTTQASAIFEHQAWARDVENETEQVRNLANNENLEIVSNGRDIKRIVKGNGDTYFWGNVYINGTLVNPAGGGEGQQDQSQSNLLSNDNTFLGNSNGYQDRPAQSFMFTADAEVTDLEFKSLGKGNTPSGNWTYRIETNNNGVPSGTLAHANASVVVTPQDSAVVKGTFATPFTLSANTIYWAVWQCDTQSVTNDRWQVAMNSTSVYPSGFAARYEVDHWVAHSDWDYYFKVYATATS